jgi:hypothetical protein
MDENASNGKGYIHDDIHGRPFLWFAIVFVAFGILAFFGVYWFYGALTGYHERNQPAAPTRVTGVDVLPSGPQLQADPVFDMVKMRSEQSAVLDTYGWVDAEKGVVRIPIEKAMEQTLEQSLVKAQVAGTPLSAAETATKGVNP